MSSQYRGIEPAFIPKTVIHHAPGETTTIYGPGVPLLVMIRDALADVGGRDPQAETSRTSVPSMKSRMRGASHSKRRERFGPVKRLARIVKR